MSDQAGVFDYRGITADAVVATSRAAIADADARVAEAIAAATDRRATFADVIGRLDDALGDLWDANGRSGFMVRVHPDEAVRAAAQAADESVTAWRESLLLRDDVAAAIAGYATTPDAGRLDGDERRLLERWQRDLRRAGHDLPTDAREELRTLTLRAVALEGAFLRNVDEWTDGIDVTREDLAGLPDGYVSGLKPGSAPGTFRVTLQNPDYGPFLEGSPRRDLREQLARKRESRAVAANRPILDELLALRRRRAAILGYPSWAHYRIEPKMARTPERVAAFHASLIPLFQRLATAEQRAMARMLEADTGDRDLRRWDTSFYQRIRVAERGADPAEVSPYLTLEAVLDGLFQLTQGVFGLRYVEVADPRAWHEDVRLFEVLDGPSGEQLGWFYADLHPRLGKYAHAMAYPVALPRQAPDGSRLGGISAIVVNVPRSTASGPARLRHYDVWVLFHEFGHVLHQVLGTNRYHGLSMWALEHDFLEAVSQIMEHWAWEPAILVRITRHAETGATLPLVLAERFAASRNVNLGVEYLHGFGRNGEFDLWVHAGEPVDLDEAMRAADAIDGLPSIDGAFWPASFGHIAAGYDAGYYGYLWSLVLGDDLWSRFVAEGIDDPAVGMAYRRAILEPGATRDADALVEAFLGRPSTNAAFLRRTGLASIAPGEGS